MSIKQYTHYQIDIKTVERKHQPGRRVQLTNTHPDTGEGSHGTLSTIDKKAQWLPSKRTEWSACPVSGIITK